MNRALLIVAILFVPGEVAAQASPRITPPPADPIAVPATDPIAVPAPAPMPQTGARQSFFGVRGGVFSESLEHAGPLVGIEGGVPIGLSDRLVFNPNAELAVADSFAYTLNADLTLTLTSQAETRVWVGAGVGYVSRSAFLRADRSGLAGNLIAGVGWGRDRTRVYTQTKIILASERHFSLVLGFRF